jgi:hypothetical protein
MGSSFKVDSRLVVQDPANWWKSSLGVFSELTHEALMVFLFLKVAGNFQMTFRVNQDVLARVAGFTGNGQDVDDILDELRCAISSRFTARIFVLTDSSAVKAEISRVPSATATSIPEPFSRLSNSVIRPLPVSVILMNWAICVGIISSHLMNINGCEMSTSTLAKAPLG